MMFRPSNEIMFPKHDTKHGLKHKWKYASKHK